MRVEQLAANGGEQTSLFRLPRIVRHISNDRTSVTGYTAVGHTRNVIYSYCCLRLVQSGSLWQVVIEEAGNFAGKTG